MALVTPTTDGVVLQVLARADSSFTAGQVHELCGVYSEAGIRKALRRLVEEGIVTEQRAGRTFLFSLNRAHLGAAAIEELARIPERLLDRLRERMGSFASPPVYAALFGSAARGDMDPNSDIDLLVVRPATTDADQTEWRRDLDHLIEDVASWTGNDTRVLEFSESGVSDALIHGEPVLEDIDREGIRLRGRPGYLRPMLVS